jgi:hypothetical protein
VALLGAPAGVLAPFLAKNLGGRLLVPPVHEVASAVGAAASPVYLKRRVEIHTLPYFVGFRLFLPDRVVDGEDLDHLAAEAENHMTPYMRSLARLAGEDRAEISVTREDRRVTLGDGGKLHLGASLTFTAGA